MFGLGKKFKPTVFALGKIPGEPEFLPAPDALASSIDRWLDEGWQALHAGSDGASWEDAFSTGRAYGFVWGHGTKASEVTYGLIAPSVDAVGRRYPLVLAGRMASPRLERGWSFVPRAAATFLGDAHALLLEATTSRESSSELAQSMSRLPLVVPEDIDTAEKAQSVWNSETPVEAGWGAIFPKDAALSAVRAVSALQAALRPCVGREWPSTPLLLRFPIGDGGPPAVVLWLEIVRAILSVRQTIPAVFWAAEGECLLVGLGPVSPSLLVGLWAGDLGDEAVIDIGRAGATPSETIEPGSREATTMAEWLQVLGRRTA